MLLTIVFPCGFKTSQKHRDKQNGGVQSAGEWESFCLINTEFQFCKTKKKMLWMWTIEQHVNAFKVTELLYLEMIQIANLMLYIFIIVRKYGERCYARNCLWRCISLLGLP